MKIDNQILSTMSDKHGDSFYILDTANFEESYDNLLNSFQKYYKKTSIAYSYKTNYIPRLCKIVDNKGGFAEVVSDMEFEAAKKIEVQKNRIFYNGPYKNPIAISELLLSGGIVNADSFTDLNFFAEIALKNPLKTLEVGIRCNFDIDDGTVSRFGISYENGDLKKAINFLNEIPNISIASLHCHFASRKINSWSNAVKGILRITDKFFNNNYKDLKYISLGGGLYGDMPKSFQEQLGIRAPSFNDYAVAAAKPFSEFFNKVDEIDKPELILEPGTALAANALKFVARVINIKYVDKKPIATLAGSYFNTNPTSGPVNLPIKVYSNNSQDSQDYFDSLDMAGYTCIESDYLYKKYRGFISVGDFVVFDSAGSYSVVMKPPFILPNVPILELSKDKILVIKRQENFNDLFRTYTTDF